MELGKFLEDNHQFFGLPLQLMSSLIKRGSQVNYMHCMVNHTIVSVLITCAWFDPPQKDVTSSNNISSGISFVEIGTCTEISVPPKHIIHPHAPPSLC